MPSDRFFAPFLPQEKEIIIDGKEFHHLFHVMRAKEGDEIEVVNGKGCLAKGVIEKLNKQDASLSLTNVIEEKEDLPSLILAQAIPKLNLLEWIIEKGTELNAKEFWLFPGKRSEKKEINANQLARLETICLSSLKQCGRLFLPKIVIKPALEKWNKPSSTILFGDLSSDAPPLSEVRDEDKEICFVIGPEKGLAESEIEALKQLGAQGIKLHKNILRAETAAICALAQLFL